MTGRFSDSARTAIQAGFRSRPVASESDVVEALASTRGSMAYRLLDAVGVRVVEIPSSVMKIGKESLVELAVAEAQRQGVAYVATEHFLLAISRIPGSQLLELEFQPTDWMS